MNERDEFYKEIGFRIKLLRLLRGISRDELASKLGISPDHLTKLENGKRHIRTESVIECSKILSTTVDFLVRGTDEFYKIYTESALNKDISK